MLRLHSRDFGILHADSRNRPLVEKAFAHVLLQAVAQGKNQSAGASQTGYVAPYGHLCGNQPQRAVATIPDVGNANGHDQRLGQGSRASICQRAVGSHSLPGYGPVISVNRLVRTRMPGGVGAGGEKPPATRLGAVTFVVGIGT
jgi:cytochrome c5